MAKITTDRNDPGLNKPTEDNQNESYLVLSDEERAKGFIRPVRQSYIHAGRRVNLLGTIFSLEEGLENCSNTAKEYYTKENGYAAYFKYTEGTSKAVGKFIKQDEVDAINNEKEFFGGCGTLTSMPLAIAQTYARDPKFYNSTFCCGCQKHIDVEEFIWDKTNQVVGS